MTDVHSKKSSPIAIGLSWLVVIIPASWGIYYTVLRAESLFK